MVEPFVLWGRRGGSYSEKMQQETWDLNWPKAQGKNFFRAHLIERVPLCELAAPALAGLHGHYTYIAFLSGVHLHV